MERNVRQLLADKICGNMTGIWLLIPEHLRLGSWELLQAWSGKTGIEVEPRLAMQLVNEAALCVNSIRRKRTMSQKGFELANGLPFVATDAAIHQLLDHHTVAEGQRLQTALGKIRWSLGHFPGRILAVDPHRIISYSKRRMALRKKNDSDPHPAKMAQLFFCLDAETEQPLCFTSATSAQTASRAAIELLNLTAAILQTSPLKPLVLADNEHYTAELFDWIYANSFFDLLTPMHNNRSVKTSIGNIPDEAYKRHWAGYATAKALYRIQNSEHGPFHQFVQRKGEEEYDFKAFLCTADRDEMEDLSCNYPQRWHIEEFYKNYQAMGWNRAGSWNLNIQYGKMTLALLAQAAGYMLRQRIGAPVEKWDAEHIANDLSEDWKEMSGLKRIPSLSLITTLPIVNCKLKVSHFYRVKLSHLEEGFLFQRMAFTLF